MSNSHHGNPFKKRSRSGCWTCRKRHQKCDEQKPTCLNCRLRGVDCGGYGITLTDFTALSDRKGQMVSRITRNRQSGRDANVIQREPRPSSTLVLEDENAESSFQLAEDNVLMELEMGLNENLDWMISDENDAQLNEIVSPAPTEGSRGWLSESRDSSVDMSTLDPSLLCMHEMPPTPQDPFDQYLFTYYMENLSLRLYPVKADQNPYRKVYGDLARESEPLLKSIMLASALHLSKQGRLPKFAIKPYRMAVQESFREGLKTQDDA